MTDGRIERIISLQLRTGVVLSGLVILAGGVLYLARHGGEQANYQHFHSQLAMDRHISGILTGVLQLRARSLIQFGLLLLIATPIARVAFALAGFALERDWTYTVVTVIVLLVLIYSLVSGATGG